MAAREADLSFCSVLLVDDELTILLSLRDSLAEAGAEVVTASSGDQAREILRGRSFDVVIADVRMPGLSGMGLLEHIRQGGSDTEVILMTAFANVETAVAAIKLGAYDYVTKPFPDERLVRMVGHIWSTVRLRREVAELRTRAPVDEELGFLVGKSEPWRQVMDRVRMVAPTDATVLVTGQSGTGKELVARALHVLSRRSEGPFVKVHCASLPSTLMESELFGHVKGAFTGAAQEAKGRFELANGGTLLLDEVDEIPLEVQVKLLRVIQERVIERVGSGRPIPVDVRLVAVSKTDLQELVSQGAFRQDLLYRLSVVLLTLPRLYERRGDVPLLLSHFLGLFSRKMMRDCTSVSHEALELLLRYDFPGNVRELEHIVEAACALSNGEPIPVSLLPEAVRQRAAALPPVRVGFHARRLDTVMEEFERSYLRHALEEFDGTRSELARILGISRKGLWEKLKKHGLAESAEEA